MNRTTTVTLLLAVLGGAAPTPAQTSETLPIDLRQAIARALERSPDIRVARADAEEAHASARLADAAFR
ncbi:MAG TPA: TolC family protein, partial [Thermoanaerobaculia bacterium]